MSFDDVLAERVRALVREEPAADEKRMFGGLAFLINGHLAVAASGGGGLLVRCDPEQTDDLIEPPHVGRFEMRGREMNGWLRIDPAGTRSEDTLARWVGIGLAHARSLPPK